MNQTNTARNSTLFLIIPIVCVVLGFALSIFVFLHLVSGNMILIIILLGLIALILSIICKKELLLVLSILVMFSLIITWGLASLVENLYGSKIVLPNAEDVKSIEIGMLSTTNRDDIDTIMAALSEARMANRNAQSDQPSGQNLLNIHLVRDAICLEGVVVGEAIWPLLYLYADGGNDLLWSPYVGIYKISPENSDILRELYADMMKANNGAS